MIHSISINRSYAMRSMVFALLLLWPLLLFGKPAYMVDSAAYQNGGERAVSFVVHKLHLQSAETREREAALPGKGKQGGSVEQKDDDGTKVARSIIYSVLAYILGGPGLTMGYLVMFQAATMALTFTALYQAIAGPGIRGFAVMVAVVTFATGLAPTVNFALPDGYAPIMLGIMMVLPFYWRKFTWPMRILLLSLATFAVAVHASHPPVAVGTAVVATAWIILLRKNCPEKPLVAAFALWLPALSGVLLVMLTGLVGFGKASIAPKHYPLALARGIDNGPARWYLENACKDRTRYAICEIYGTHIPETVQELLWSKNNLVKRATPQQLDRIRAEEKTILIHSTLRYPLQQFYLIAHDVPEQFVAFRLNYLRYGSSIVRNNKGAIILRNPGSGDIPETLGWLDILTHISVILGTVLLAWWWKQMTVAQRGVLLILVTGLLVNAAVCAIFSGVAARYQARIIWLVPFLAIAFAHARGGRLSSRVAEVRRGR